MLDDVPYFRKWWGGIQTPDIEEKYGVVVFLSTDFKKKKTTAMNFVFLQIWEDHELSNSSQKCHLSFLPGPAFPTQFVQSHCSHHLGFVWLVFFFRIRTHGILHHHFSPPFGKLCFLFFLTTLRKSNYIQVLLSNS